MATLNIEGKKVTVDDAFLSMPPDQQAATVDEIAKSIGVQSKATQTQDQTQNTDQPSPQMQDFQSGMQGDLQKFMNGNDGALRNADSFMRGAADTATFGLADEIAGVGNTFVDKSNPFKTDEHGLVIPADPVTGAIKAIGGLFSDNSDTSRAIRRERAFQTQRDGLDPVASTSGRVAGALTGAVGLTKAGAPLMATLPADASFAAKTALAAKNGALYSGLYGLGSGEGVADRLKEGAKGAITGGLIGGAIPGVTAVAKAVSKPLTDAVRGYMNPAAFANAKIAERISNAGMDVNQAANKLERNPGVALADVGGKSTQNLLRSATNIPGKAQDYVVSTLNKRQLAQGDRLKTIIRDTFADPDAFEANRTRLFQIQAETSQPLYERALARQNVWNDRLNQFLTDPVTRRGIAQGMRIQRLESLAENRPFNPHDYAITGFNEAGDPIISGVPNMRTINVIKKGLDAMLEDARHPITGRLTEEGRAIDQVRRAFLTEVDRVNPDYAVARRHYATFMQANEAMELGREAFTMSPQALRARVADMNPMQRLAARAGAAEAMRRAIDEAGWTNNAALKLFGSRQKTENLRTLFNSDQEFAEARKQVFAEIRKRTTYDKVKGNSTTAQQLVDLGEAGGLKDTVDFAGRAATQGITSATLQFVGSRLKMLGGFTPEVADQVAHKLLATNPQSVRQIIGQLQQIENAKISADQRRQLVTRLIAPMLSEQVQGQSRQ